MIMKIASQDYSQIRAEASVYLGDSPGMQKNIPL